MVRRNAFTLVELVVVIMILGILAAVAVPKLVSTTGNATDNGLRQTLAVVRDAIDVYAAQNASKFPPADSETNFKKALEPYIRGAFPKSPVGKKDDSIKLDTSTEAGAAITADGSTSWIYCSKDGRFIANCSDKANDGNTKYSEF